MTTRDELPKRLSIVRHAHAGDRSTFVGNDALRPLSKKGIWQAEAIAKSLAISEPLLVVSSPAIRCVATVTPLARKYRCGIEELGILSEGGDPKEALATLIELVEGPYQSVVACSHGDVIGGIVELLLDANTPAVGTPSIKKASIVELDVVAGTVTKMYFVPPPKHA